MRVRLLATLAAAVVLGGMAVPASASPLPEVGALAGRFIVVLDDDSSVTPAVAARAAEARGAEISHIYSNALRGYAASLPTSLLTALQADADVAAIEPDRVIRISETQSSPPYGLDRIDQRSLPLDNSYSYAATGAGVTAYVVDTGIRLSHQDFGGRTVSGFDAVDGGPADDCHGHGTHVAGTVGGSTYGVAKEVTLVAIRVLDCNGSGAISGVIAGIDWATAHHQPGQPAVTNLSLGGSASKALDSAVERSIADGITYAVAAGNGNLIGMPEDACTVSPARVPAAITVGATDSSDRAASFSNYGPCVDWYAPGVAVASAWNTEDAATKTISGTSMAAPHVAGAAALYLQTQPSAAPATVTDALRAATTKAVVTGVGGGGLLGTGLLGSPTPNKDLLYTG